MGVRVESLKKKPKAWHIIKNVQEYVSQRQSAVLKPFSLIFSESGIGEEKAQKPVIDFLQMLLIRKCV